MGAIERNGTDGAAPDGPPLSPLSAFFVLAVAAVVAGALVFAASRPDSSSDSPPVTTHAAGSPTAPASPIANPSTIGESEAEAIFEDLRSGLEEAYRRRSIEALRAVVGRGSPQFTQGRSDLRLLRQNNLLDRTRSRALEVTVVYIDDNRLVVRERALVRPRYVDDATHVELDANTTRTASTSEWTLERRGTRWVIISSRTAD
ncbi:MAG: hypothetical protein ACRDJL_08825 [Actinomycetota bacterium]